MNYSILLASVLISSAILLNGHLDRRQAQAPAGVRPTLAQINESTQRAFKHAFSTSGPNIVIKKPRVLKEVVVKNVRFGPGEDKAKIEFTLNFEDGEGCHSSYALVRDDYGDYSGKWRFGEKEAYVFVTQPGAQGY